MNISVYLFGDLGNGYTQYPNDYTHTIFSTFYQKSQATTQITIYRKNDLMYYGYVRKLEGNNYVGICVVINGKMVCQTDGLFAIYEGIIELMVRNGYLIHFNDKGEMVSKVGALYENREEIDIITLSLQVSFDKLEALSKKLPSVSYGVSNDSVRSYSVQDDKDEILKSSYTNGYTFIYKSKEYNTAQVNSYREVLSKISKERDRLKDRCNNLTSQLREERVKQRNLRWVSILGVVLIICVSVIWNKVLFPSEVTKKDMGEYVYYGPMQNGEPNGIGVAIYSPIDLDERLYYYGNFKDGKRIDENAIMFYKDGSYFKGSMDEDCWQKGILFDVDKEHFIGEFKDNEPWNGEWYKHEKVQTIKNGKNVK